MLLTKHQRIKQHCIAVHRDPWIGFYLITAGVVRLLKVDRNLMKQRNRSEKRRHNYQELSDYRTGKATGS